MNTPTAHTEFYFATISGGKIAVFTAGFPDQPLESCQIELSAQEYALLRHVRGDVKLAKKLIKTIDSKIKANGS